MNRDLTGRKVPTCRVTGHAVLDRFHLSGKRALCNALIKSKRRVFVRRQASAPKVPKKLGFSKTGCGGSALLASGYMGLLLSSYGVTGSHRQGVGCDLDFRRFPR